LGATTRARAEAGKSSRSAMGSSGLEFGNLGGGYDALTVVKHYCHF